MPHYISYDGKLIGGSANCISAANRSFRYGDGVFETIKVIQGVVLWSDYHYRRLIKSAAMMKLIIPDWFSPEGFVSVIKNLYRKNHFNGEPARIRFALFRQEGGYYTPTNHHTSYLIESARLPVGTYPFPSEGLRLGIYPLQRKAINEFSALKTCSALLYVMAAIYKTEHGFDDCIILNEQGHVAEAISSNIFVVQGDRLYTPGLDQGCVDGVMRAVLLRLFSEQKMDIEEAPLLPSALLDADEVFVTNAINGISWVCRFQDTLYTNDMARRLTSMLNNALTDLYPL